MFGEDLFPMHAAACAAARQATIRPVPARFDVVITTNSGFPLDQNPYQAVKGMSAAYQVVRSGGMIVCAAECRDGFPDHSSYRQVLASAASPRALTDAIRARPVTVQDQWQVQIQAQIQASSRVTAVADSVSRANQVKSGFTGRRRRTSTRGGAHDCPRPAICPPPPG